MLLPPSEIKKIGIFRALQIGDLLCTVPAIRALRHAYPDAEITLIGLPWSKLLLERLPEYFDSFIHFPGFPGLPEQDFKPNDFVSFLQRVQEKSFDLVIQMQGNGSIVNPMIELFGARYYAGYFKKDHYYRDNELFLEYPETGHGVERHLSLMKHLGIPEQGVDLEFPIQEKDYDDLEVAGLVFERSNYVCIHPGARAVSRRWPAENYAKVADLVIENGLEAVLTGVTAELPIINDIKAHMKHEPKVAAGDISLGAAAALIKNSFGLISNCTGVSHIASALKKKSMVISLEKEVDRWAPINREVHSVINWHQDPSVESVLLQTKRWLN